MNLGEKARQYLYKQLDQFSDIQSLKETKTEFFDAIKDFRQRVVVDLSHCGVFEGHEIQELETLLLKIDSHRTKTGSGNSVYWPGTGDDFNAAKLLLSKMATRAGQRKVPRFLEIKESIRDHKVIIIVALRWQADVPVCLAEQAGGARGPHPNKFECATQAPTGVSQRQVRDNHVVTVFFP